MWIMVPVAEAHTYLMDPQSQTPHTHLIIPFSPLIIPFPPPIIPFSPLPLVSFKIRSSKPSSSEISVVMYDDPSRLPQVDRGLRQAREADEDEDVDPLEPGRTQNYLREGTELQTLSTEP